MTPPKMPNSSTLPSGGRPSSYGSNGSPLAASLFGGAASLAEASPDAAALAEASLVAPSVLETDTAPDPVPAACAKALPATVRLKLQTTQLVSGLDIS